MYKVKSRILREVTVVNLDSYQSYVWDLEKPPFRASLYDVSTYPTVSVQSLSTGKCYGLYPNSIKEFCIKGDYYDYDLVKKYTLHFLIKDRDMSLGEKVFEINKLYKKH